MKHAFDLWELAGNHGPVTITGAEVRRAREQLRMTQPQLADLVGVSVSTVSNWERGHTEPKNREAVLRTVLRLDADDQPAPPVNPTEDLTALTDGEFFGLWNRLTGELQRRYYVAVAAAAVAAEPPRRAGLPAAPRFTEPKNTGGQAGGRASSNG